MVDKFSFKKGYKARSLFIIANYTFMAILMVMMIFPILTVLSDSVDTSGAYGLSLIPSKVSLEGYKQIISNISLYRPFGISLLTTISGTFIGLTLTTIAAYVLIQEEMPLRKLIVAMLMFTMIFNAGLIPTYMTIKNLGIIDKIWAVILPAAINTYNIVLMKSFFENLPKSLFESADIDGCTPFKTFYKIALPLSKPALASIGLFFAVAYWNEFFAYVVYISNTKWYNFQVKLREMVLSASLQTDQASGLDSKVLQNAAIIVAMVPFMILYPFLQKYFVKGITLGAVKG